MKLKSLIPLLAVLTFALTASAQSDPSVGGSFGTSFDHSVTPDISVVSQSPNPYAFTTTSTTTVHNRTFWDRMTGRNRYVAPTPPHSNGRHMGWHNPHNPHSRPAPVNTNPKKSGWHLPWFNRR